MKIVQTVVSSHGFRDQAANPDRVALLGDLARLCASEDARLLLIPAGFLTADSEENVPELVQEVRRVAKVAGVAVIGGIDVNGAVSKRSLSMEEAVREGRIGYFGFAAGAGVMPSKGRCWRQTSITSADAKDFPQDSIPGAERVVRVDGLRIAILICGELFNWKIRNAVSEMGSDLVVDIGHVSMGTGTIPAMRSVAKKSECPVAHSHHLKWYGGSLHFVDAQGRQQSVPVDDEHVIQQGGMWAAWAVRTV